ncbi:phosphoheptose isomerase [Solimonas terrae]|uniref:Phosphoheptose isomerase n=1 Tax=Solimonas terrae TaxID=1396819 RepID=A0A6M2BSM6_9GAMM|nr:phosphoheptose isomerase [Solimonas terrae]NGY05245.1 phosphoheptose isomerase [Solimonas terrae]
MIEQRLQAQFAASIAAKQATQAQALPALARAAQALASALADGYKVLACGNGGSAADAQHFAAELTGRYERERPGLPGIALSVDTSALTAIGNDYGFDRVFAKQVDALGRSGDWLLAISTSGNSTNVIKAIEAAQARGLHVIALTGKSGGAIAKLLRTTDIELRAVSEVTARIQEVHILFLHCLCDAIDELLYPAP